MLKRYKNNPILKPIENHLWEASAVFNAGAISLNGLVHLVYRTQDKKDGVSCIGYASSVDGMNFSKRTDIPVYEKNPENELEGLGCEDPRLSIIGDRVFMNYNSYGVLPGLTFRKYTQFQIALTSIAVNDFMEGNWNWEKPLYPLPLVDNKGACFFPEKICGKWVMYHRIFPHIWVAYSDNLKDWHDMKPIMEPAEKWEYYKLSTGPPPIKTKKGWLILYNASDTDLQRSIGFALADLNDPSKIIYRSKTPILKPEKEYEKNGNRPGVVYCNGAVALNDILYVYYGAADTCLCLATIKLSELLVNIKS